MNTRGKKIHSEVREAEREVVEATMKWAEIDFGYDADLEKAVERACVRLRKARRKETVVPQ